QIMIDSNAKLRSIQMPFCNWRLDVVMNEDDCKIRRGNAAELFSGIRHIAINILTNDKVFKAGLRRKMRKAAMDRNYLASVLAGSGLS
uniref:transposase n=1 Tax=Escherichia coli TaxID=562 RepID=UPI001560739F